VRDRRLGVERIADERERQVSKEGWGPSHDDEHDDESLAFAAVCYAAPVRVYVKEGYTSYPDGMKVVTFREAWPQSWDSDWFKVKKGKNGRRVKQSRKDRVRQLEKAGALIAAEIDRLLRLGPARR